MTSRRPPHNVTRALLQLALLAVVVIAAGVGAVRAAHWYSYRRDHIVTRDAAVCGRMTDVGPQIDGQVARVHVREGDRVVEGQVLAELADGPLRARVAERRAALARAEEALAVERLAIDFERRRLEVALDRRRAELEEAEAGVDVAESHLPRWKNELARTEAMVEKRAVSANRLDEVRAARNAAEATHALRQGRRRTAEARHSAAGVDLDGVQVLEANLRVLEAELSIAQAALERAEAELEATVLRAPADGRVGSIARGPNASVRVGQPVLALWLDDELWIDAWIDEEELGDVHLGGGAFVSLDAHPGEVFEGRVEAIVALPPETTRERAQASASSPILATRARLRTRIRFDPREHQVLPGLSAVVGIAREDEPDDAGGLGPLAGGGPRTGDRSRTGEGH